MIKIKNRSTKRKMEVLRDFLTKVNQEASATHYDHTNGVYYRLDNNRSRYDFWKNYCSYVGNREKYVSRKSSSSSSEDDGFSSEEEDDTKERLVDDTIILSELVTPDENIPLRLTFDFKIDTDRLNKNKGGAIYDTRLPLAIIAYTQAAIKDTYVIEDRLSLVCCLFEKRKQRKENDKSIVNIQLHFPNLRTSYNTIRDMLIPTIIKKVTILSDDILSNFSVRPEDNWNDIVGAEDMKRYYYMYQCDDPTNPFILSSIHGFIKNNDAIYGKENTIEQNKVFDIKKHKDYGQNLLGKDKDIYTKRGLLYYMFYTKNYGDKVTTINQIVDNTNIKRNKRFFGRPDDFNELKELKFYLNMIKQKRINTKHSWESIGKALYHFCQYNKRKKKNIRESDGLNMWMKITQESNIFKPSECRKLYNKFDREEKVTYKTIAWYARCDNPANYEEYKIMRFGRAVKKAIKMYGRKYEEAVALVVLLDLDFACTGDGKSVTWFEYNKNRWNKLGRISELRNFISTTYTDYLKDIKHSYIERRREIDNDDTSKSKKEKYNRYIKKLSKMIRDAGDLVSKTKMVKHISDVMNVPNMDNLFDTNWSIMGVKNGILETNEKGIYFREGKPEDFVLKQSRVKYKHYNWKSKKVKWVMKWFQQMQPNKENMEYFGKSMSVFFEGGNRPKKAFFLVGPTGGGKSVLVEFISRIFEGYQSTLPETEITVTNNDKQGPNPYLAAAINSNIAWINELMGIVDAKKFKMKTGNDKLLSRFLNENGSSKKPRFKILATSNFLPIFQNSDDSMVDRVVIIMMYSRWVKNAPKNEEEQIRLRRFPRDDNFEDKFDSTISAGLWVLMQYFNKYKKEGLNMPKDIKKTIEDYWREKDVIGSFIKDSITKVDDDNNNALLRLDTVYRKYKSWLENNYPNMEPLDKDKILVTLKDRFLSYKWSEYDSNGWPGLKLIGYAGFS